MRMAPHAASSRHVVFPPTAMLEARHLEDCQMLPSRAELIGKMRPGGVGAELGVEEGKFSRVIVERCRPSSCT